MSDTNGQSNSERLDALLQTKGTSDDPFQHLTYFRLLHPEIADDLTEYERLANRQMKLLEERDNIDLRLSKLDDEIEEHAEEIRDFLSELDDTELATDSGVGFM